MIMNDREGRGPATESARSLLSRSARLRFRYGPIRGSLKYLIKAEATTIMAHIPNQPPEDENLDLALDEQDATGDSSGERDIEDMTADRTELEEAGADLEDEGQISILEGGVDDPDGSGPARDRDDTEAGWDVDPVTADRGGVEQVDEGAEGAAVTENEVIDVPNIEDESELEVIDTDPGDMEQIPDDSPIADPDRW